MHRIFIDTDIILDVFAQREPFYVSAAKLFTLIDRNEIIGYSSPIVFTNIHYILSRLTSKASARSNLRKLKSMIIVLPIDEKTIELALNSDFHDFEDALQYHTAKSHDIKFLITRNKRDYKKSKISVCTAEEYLKIWASHTKD